MERFFTETEDGSSSLYVPGLNEHYHSIHGAIQESLHIFIGAGIEYYAQKNIAILEAGFGTGLNAYLSLLYAGQEHCRIHYTTIEKYPLDPTEAEKLNYKKLLPADPPQLFDSLHSCPWAEDVALTPCFTLHKLKQDFREGRLPAETDIVFFDAFNPEVQPHLWTAEVFRRFYAALKPGGILVTYCVKGIVKQALRAAGFTLKRLPGPPGKREILRATRPL